MFVHNCISTDSTCLHQSDCGPDAANATDVDEIEELICQSNWHCVDNICRCQPTFGFGGGFGGGADGGGGGFGGK